MRHSFRGRVSVVNDNKSARIITAVARIQFQPWSPLTQIVLACLAAVALAAPRPQDDPVAILRDDRQDDGDGNFKYEFESDDGTFVSAVGTPGAEGQSNIQGSYR